MTYTEPMRTIPSLNVTPATADETMLNIYRRLRVVHDCPACGVGMMMQSDSPTPEDATEAEYECILFWCGHKEKRSIRP